MRSVLLDPKAPPPRPFVRLRPRAAAIARQPAAAKRLAERAYTKFRALRPHLRTLRSDLPTLIRLTRAYAGGQYRALPWKALVAAVTALLYFVIPLDAIPDAIPLIGYLDDAAVVAFVMRLLRVEVGQFRAWEATSGPP